MFSKTVRFILAGMVAVCADLIQLVLFPFFGWGAANPVNSILDFMVAGIMVGLLGFHWVFLPSLVGEMVPGANLMPLWTGAVFVVGMGEYWQKQQQNGVQQPVAMAAFSPMFAQPVAPMSNAPQAALPPAPQTQPQIYQPPASN